MLWISDGFHFLSSIAEEILEQLLMIIVTKRGLNEIKIAKGKLSLATGKIIELEALRGHSFTVNVLLLFLPILALLDIFILLLWWYYIWSEEV